MAAAGPSDGAVVAARPPIGAVDDAGGTSDADADAAADFVHTVGR